MEFGGVGSMPERFFEDLTGTAVKLSRPLPASRGFGISTDADLPWRAIPRAETVGGAIVRGVLRVLIVRVSELRIMSQPEVREMRDASCSEMVVRCCMNRCRME
jgi:hypothetical protein